MIGKIILEDHWDLVHLFQWPANPTMVSKILAIHFS